MSKKLLLSSLALLALWGIGCKSNPHKAQEIDTKIESKGEISGDTSVGIKDGNMVVQKKVEMNEEVRRLQNEVFELEDRVYGNRKYGSMGLYGVLRQCKLDVSDIKNGGDGKLRWTEPIDRITDKEEEWKIGLDEKQKLVGISEEFLMDRIQRFRGYKKVLMQREDEYEEKVQICKAQLKAQKAKTSAPTTQEQAD
jgi:hypothetical protein